MNHFPENVYYEAKLPNLTNQPILAKFSETRQQPFIEKPQRWEVSVPDFDIPLSNVPIFIFEDNNPAPVAPETIYETGYWITIEDDVGNVEEGVVSYNPVQNEFNLPPPYNRAIQHYNLFITQINKTLAELWYIGLNEPDASAPPFIFFEESVAQFKFVLPATDGVTPYIWYNGTNTVGSYKIWFNNKLHSKFYFTAQDTATGDNHPTDAKDYLIMFTNMTYVPVANNYFFPNLYKPAPRYPANTIYIPAINSYTFNQEFSTLPEWFEYKRVLLTSNTLPLYYKQIGDASNLGSALAFAILMDYAISNAAPYNRSDLQYSTNGGIRWISMQESNDLRNIDVSAVLLGKDGNTTLPILIAPDKAFFVSLRFRRKESSIRDDALREMQAGFLEKINRI